MQTQTQTPPQMITHLNVSNFTNNYSHNMIKLEVYTFNKKMNSSMQPKGMSVKLDTY